MIKKTTLMPIFLLLAFFPAAHAWTDADGGDHAGADWTISTTTTIGGFHYNIGTFTVNTGVSANINPWNGTGGGCVNITANVVSVVGTINASIVGFRGGAATTSTYGESPGGYVASDGGGLGSGGTSAEPGGGGGAYGGHGGNAATAEADVTNGTGNAGGTAYGTATGEDIQMGSGGGGHYVLGGGGGGCVNLTGTTSLTVSGTIIAVGQNGDDVGGLQYGASGGGAGGGIFLKSPGSVTITGTINATGGAGGLDNSASGANAGGAGGGGGGGRVKVFYSTLSNASATVIVAGGPGGVQWGLPDPGIPGTIAWVQTTNPINVTIRAPTAGSYSISNPINLTFTTENSTGNMNADGVTVDWGDGTTNASLGDLSNPSTGYYNISHTYASAGDYTILVESSAASYDNGTDTVDITITQPPLTVDILEPTASQQICESGNANVTFNVTAESGSQETALTDAFVYWDTGISSTLGDGNVTHSGNGIYISNYSYSVTENTAKTITLSANKSGTGNGTDSVSVTILDAGTVITITNPSDGGAGVVDQEVSITGTLTEGCANVDGTMTIDVTKGTSISGYPKTSIAVSGGDFSDAFTPTEAGVYIINASYNGVNKTATITVASLNPAGRYLVPSGIEVEGSTTASCSDTDCHLVSNDFGSPGTGACFQADGISDCNNIPHPGSGRDVAGFYPDWVHRHHGGNNWPQWSYSSTTTADAPLATQTDPSQWVSTYYSGTGDAQIGTGGDISFRRMQYLIGRGSLYSTGMYVGAKQNTGTQPNPTIPQTCAYGTQANDGYATQQSMGCHGLRVGTTSYARTDTITCEKCHSLTDAANITSTNTRHGGTGAQCPDCHSSTGSFTAGPVLDATANVTIKECWQCHSITPLNTSFAHAGKDCRYCHGHAHNVTKETTWNTTCGGTDTICHSSVGTIDHDITGNAPTCMDCHIPTGDTAHNITIPACSNCHNTTSTWGAARANATVPNWLTTGTNLTHGDTDRGTQGNLSCDTCHADSGYHSANFKNNYATQGCNNTACHSGGSRAASGVRSIAESHSNVSCIACHSNGTIESLTSSSRKNLDTNLHASNSSWLIPFNLTKTNATFGEADCKLCHDNIDSTGCDSCHGSYEIHRIGMGVSATVDGSHEAGGPNCSTCHMTGSGTAPDVNYTVFNNSIHRWINNASNEGNETASMDTACRGCHVSDGGESHHNTYRYCWDCHNGTVAYTNLSNTPMVSEHFVSATDIYAVTGAASNNASCVSCHDKPEMLLAFTDDLNRGNGRNGSMYNISHYGRSRAMELRFIENGNNVTSCTYCHQNASTAFSGTMVGTNRTAMINHTNRSAGPSCSNETGCHSQGRIHDSSLTKPTFNSALCMTCHPDRQNHSASDSGGGALCMDCHTNSSRNGWDIHGINGTYLQNTGNTYGSNTSAVKCANCHQNTSAVIGLSTTPPRIPDTLNHSNSDSSGELWGSYWNDSDSSKTNDSCRYCHGDTKHNNTGLGTVDQLPGTVNESISATTVWCRSCHWNESGSGFYIGDQFSTPPPEITRVNDDFYNKNPSMYYNHTLSNYNDSVCDDCHSPSPAPTKITDLMHDVRVGQAGGANCTASACHGAGSMYVDGTTFAASSVHKGLNSGYTPPAGVPAYMAACYACHMNGTEPEEGVHNNANQNGGFDYKSPGTCEACHLNVTGYYENTTVLAQYSAPQVKEHFPVDTSVATSALESNEDYVVTNTTHSGDTSKNATCEQCHKNDIESHDDTAQGIGSASLSEQWRANISHYGGNTTLVNGTDCVACHLGSASVRANYGVGPDIANSARMSHSYTQNSECVDCHHNDGLAIHDEGIDVKGGNANCATTGCHKAGTSPAYPDVDFSAFNQTSIHRWINNASLYSGDQSIEAACRGCHVTGGVAAHKNRDPYLCWDCHNGTAAYGNVSNAPAVAEHYVSASDIYAVTGEANNNASCMACHNLPEMKFSFSEDDSGVGGNGSLPNVSHYGKKRTDMLSVVANTNITDCAYCHKNASTAFPFAGAGNMSIANHTNRTTNPNCYDLNCHNSGRIHDANLTKPALSATDDTVCYNCHNTILSDKKDRHNGTIKCTVCHTNTSLGGKDIHTIKYLTTSGTWSESNSSAANCTTCHTGSGITTVAAMAGAPKVPTPLNHSDNTSAGTIWGSYWNDNDGGSNSSCYACHGSMTHNATLWGNFQGNNDVNATIGSGTWCASCHYAAYSSGSDDYATMTGFFTAAGLPVPPEIGNDSTYAPDTLPGYYNHSQLASNYTDAMCYVCHGELLTSGSGMTEFLHDVKGGTEVGGGPDCTQCHKMNGPENRRVNVSAMNLSVPWAYGVHGKINTTDDPDYEDDEPCWACHGNGTKPPDKKHNFDDDDQRYKSPRDCKYCHKKGSSLWSAADVYEHRDDSTDVTTGATCEDCHNNSVINATDDDYIPSATANVSHYASNTLLKPSNTNTTDCNACHKAVTQERVKWRASSTNMGNANAFDTSDGCYVCHNATVFSHDTDTFHSDNLQEWLWNCETCHPPPPPSAGY